MAQGLYRSQLQWDRVSPSLEDVAVIDMGWVHWPSTSQSAVAAVGFIHDTTTGITSADATALGHLADELENFVVDLATGQMTNKATLRALKITRMDGAHPVPNVPVLTRVEAYSNGGANALAPQVAMTATLKTATRKRWGRVYLPSLTTGLTDAYGRWSHATCDAAAGFLRDLYDDVAAFDWYPVVFRKGTTTGECEAVNTISVDDVPDVIRRRRYDRATYHGVSSLI